MKHRPASRAIAPPVPPGEEARLEALERYEVLDTLPEQSYDDITRMASELCRAPISLVSLVDRHRQWFKSRQGLEARETPRDVAFCAHAIVERDLLIVPDALADERFAGNPLVTGEPGIRFYAGAPLVTPDGHALGTLCVIDRTQRELTASQTESLRALSRQVISLLELRRSLSAEQQAHRMLQASQDELQRAYRGLEAESLRDDVTGHHNTRFLHRALAENLDGDEAGRRGLSIVFFDMDGFKSVVDEHGHLVGSRVLREVAEVVSGVLESRDGLVRYGGDEFVAVLPGQRTEAARAKAEHMRAAIRSHVFRRDEGLAIRLTASFGIASHPDDAPDAEGLLGAADRGLFRSKERGKDRVSPPGGVARVPAHPPA